MYMLYRPLIRIIVQSFIFVGFLSLAACDSIEHRSEAIPKEPLPKLVLSQTEPRVVWSNTQGNGLGNRDAKLELAFAQHHLITADVKGEIRALNCKTGALIWQAVTKTTLSSGPSVINDYVLVGTHDGQLRAHRVSDGTFLWQIPLTGEMLAVANGDKGVAYVHTMDGSLTAIKAETGEQLWRYSLSTPPIVLRKSSRPAITNNRVFVGFANGRLTVINRTDGSLDWEREVTIPKGRSDIQRMADLSADPEVVGNIVYVVGYQGRLAALSTETGNSIWEKDLSSYSGMALNKERLYISDAKGSLWALDRKSGKVLWEQTALKGRRLTKPSVINDLVVVGDDDGYLHCVSAIDGGFKGRLQVDSKGIEATPLWHDNALYVLGKGGKIAALSLPALKSIEVN